MPKTSIIGYSERGLVSSFLFGLACLPKSGTLINKIMLKAYGGKNWQGKITGVKILIEPTLSQFGDPDAIFILKYLPLQSPKRQTRTIFVEAKYNVAIKKEWQKFSDKTCNSSNLFRQLELKKIFLDAKKAQENRKNRNTSNVKSILDTDPRFTGYSKIVEKIVKGINCGRGQDYYLAIIKEYPDKCTMESVQKEFSKVCGGRFGIITWRELKELTRGQKLAYFNNTYNFNEVS